ncbi:hypothetical protein DFP73DRAFT_272482 [Morchella snyderi]|nr:hypothetical protein DFP73DRAFT_272482 [Morchella snyderi]
MLDTSSKEPEFPDLSQIGLAFAQAITYINYQPCPDLDENARQWLVDAATNIMAQLRTELNELQQNKDNRIKLPAWALDSEETLRISSIVVPHTLNKYEGQFGRCLTDLMKACGFDTGPEPPRYSKIFPYLIFRLRFREAGLRRPTEAHEPGELHSDKVFMKKLYETMNGLRITQ